MAGVTKWYAVGLVERPSKGPGGAPRYDTVYQEAPGNMPLTRAQIQRYHAAQGGVPTFRTTAPPWERPQEPPSAPDSTPDAPSGAYIAGAAAGGMWAVFTAVLPFAFLSC